MAAIDGLRRLPARRAIDCGTTAEAMPEPRHLIFLIADHFEPRERRQVAAWSEGYPAMARRFRDADGRPPRHTWFYDGRDPATLDALGDLARRGLGEVELHLHHGNDTPQTLAEKLEETKALYNRHGALVTSGASPEQAFGVAHGKWSLCNSRGSRHCGVNEELGVLRRAGCYADFTFPAWGPMNPRKKNAIYYASDAPGRRKGYDTGADVEVGRAPSGDLLIFEGPGDVSGIPERFAKRPWLRRFANTFWLTTDATDFNPPTLSRLERWVARGVGVKGRPDWVFVKVQTHGARESAWSACFGGAAERFYAEALERFNDGRQWRLHFAAAREAYNMVKAAEAGRAGDPGGLRDFAVGPYQNTL